MQNKSAKHAQHAVDRVVHLGVIRVETSTVQSAIIILTNILTGYKKKCIKTLLSMGSCKK